MLSCHTSNQRTATEQATGRQETERLDTVSLKQLSGTEWVQVRPKCGDSYQIIGFSDSIFTRKITINKILSTWKFRFYLSDGIPERFDFSRVGMSDSGTHIVKYDSDSRSILCNKVISIHGDSLTLFCKNEPSSSINNIRDTVFVFKRLRPVSSKQLDGTAWTYIESVGKTDFEVIGFSSELMQYVDHTDYEDFPLGSQKYYLSPTVGEPFDSLKVGKPTSGNYLYTQDVESDWSEKWLIETLDEEKGIMVTRGSHRFTNMENKCILKRIYPK